MKIGIYDPYLDTLSGGERYMLTAASCLSENNQVSIFWNDPSIQETVLRKLNIDLSKTQIIPNIFSPKISISSRIDQTRAFDILFILSDGSIPFTISPKTILHFQSPVEWVNGSSLKNKIKLRKINKIICNSVFTKKYIDKKFNVKSDVLYPPCVSLAKINLIEEHLKKNNKKNIILNVGRFNPLPEGGSIKKQEEMVRIFQYMFDNGLRNWELLLAVSFFKENQKYIDKLRENAAGYPVKIIVNCPYEELEQIFLDAKIYWHAAGFKEDLITNPDRAEHFGITTVEAMAHSVVPVVICAGGQPEIVNDSINGFLWETEEEMIRKTVKIMIDDKLRSQMGKLAFIKSKQFTTEKFSSGIQKIIGEL